MTVISTGVLLKSQLFLLLNMSSREAGSVGLRSQVEFMNSIFNMSKLRYLLEQVKMSRRKLGKRHFREKAQARDTNEYIFSVLIVFKAVEVIGI